MSQLQNSIFFAMVDTCSTRILYVGYGQMAPRGPYVIFPLDAESRLLADIFLGRAVVETFVDVIRNFDVDKHLFLPAYRPNKRDWESLKEFTLVGRTWWSPHDSVIFLERVGVDTVLKGLDAAEQKAREDGQKDMLQSQQIYAKLQSVHAARQGMDVLLKSRNAADNREILRNALKAKLGKMKGDKP